MKKLVSFLLLALLLLSVCSCGDKGEGRGFYVIKSEDNQNSVMTYACTYRNSYNKKTRTLTFAQIDENGEEIGYGEATYDEMGRRLTYKLQDGNKNTYLSQEFTYDKTGNCTEIYTRMLGSPDCMDYQSYENGIRIGGMLCYYDENGEIESTEIYRISNSEKGSMIVYYETDGTAIASSFYKEYFDQKGNLTEKITYDDAEYTKQGDRVRYTYEWIAIE